ncbi:hypothetical protein ACRQ5Q_14490 [Bradyrhizobium sp. PMVTL-01]|uniref:hypothetical protein n=1 Tax=Bradyrhizobium sp. PMVTL-01 TaxID=3434999 RepID=UPI003F722D7D
MNQVIDRDDRLSSLEAFAATSAASGPALPATVPTQYLEERKVGAQNVQVHRDETRVLQKLAALAAAAGDDWYYRFPVKNRQKGTTDYIEGPSIKLANDLARLYGNCAVDVRVQDLGSSWLIYARFVDYETGFEMTRPFQQAKGGSRMGGRGDDADARRLDIAMQIGTSKAIRNVVVNSLQTFADFAFDQAKNSLVEKIGKNLVGYRDRTVAGIENHGITIDRVEAVIGKATKDWTAPDISRVIALMKGIMDGMSTAEETFPSREQPKEDTKLGDFVAQAKTGDTVNAETGEVTDASTDQTQQTQASQSSSQDASSGAEDATGGAATQEKGPSAADAAPPAPKTEDEYIAYANAWIESATSGEERKARWLREKPMREAAGVQADAAKALETKLKEKAAPQKK